MCINKIFNLIKINFQNILLIHIHTLVMWNFPILGVFNPECAANECILMQTGWIQASHRVTRRLAWDPTCLLLSPSFLIKNKQNLKVLKSRRHYNLFLENYPAFNAYKASTINTTDIILFCQKCVFQKLIFLYLNWFLLYVVTICMNPLELKWDNSIE